MSTSFYGFVFYYIILLVQTIRYMTKTADLPDLGLIKEKLK